jgi:hypothetical protein
MKKTSSAILLRLPPGARRMVRAFAAMSIGSGPQPILAPLSCAVIPMK